MRAGLALLLMIGFIVLGFAISTAAIESSDRMIGDFLHSLRAEGLNSMMSVVGGLGATSAFAVVLALGAAVLLWLRKGKEALLLVVTLIAAWLSNSLLKNWIARERPVDWERLAEADGYSFPSGNAMISLAFYGLIALMLLRSGNGWGRSAAIVVYIFIFLIGVSRIYLGVHYASDIIGGFLAGGTLLALAALALRTKQDRKTDYYFKNVIKR
ncbi:phosphatase PAP2 family protein [Paenibacillus sp. J2TS4]|uniref:phosphatase PAP2 family protein n=1 Tax=Paenibacillus sp. J2TS4 TaxID=2807194 RepID=UPI001B2B3572|nr:phosphatase PAP2 family protein [Paenibacillus sp. J2TS4]GIP33352.1 phosphatidylglycerophosphatase B [Paenibacillus sp. J2TS4]